MSWELNVLSDLENQGLRLTTPRRLIIRTIAKHPNPFTAEELVDLLDDVGRATIYRTLEVLADGHWLTRIHQETGNHAYMPALPHKHQLVCTACGKTVVFDTCDLEGVLQQLGQNTGFTIQGHSVEAFGLCQNCRSRVPSRS